MKDYASVEGVLYYIPKRKYSEYKIMYDEALKSENENLNDALCRWVINECKLIGTVDALKYS